MLTDEKSEELVERIQRGDRRVGVRLAREKLGTAPKDGDDDAIQEEG